MQNDGKTEETLVDNSKKADNIVSSQLNDATKPLPPPEAALPRVSISSSKKRVVRCIWPRDPEGPAMAAGQLPHGKVAGNNQRNWGATLNDFYWVQRIPEVPSGLTRVSGSRLAAWMKETGEVEYAKEEIEWAEVEDQPREIFPCDVGCLLEDRDPSIFSSRPLEHLDVFSRTESDEKVAFLFPFGSSLNSQYRFFLKRGTRRTKPILFNNEYRFTFYHRSSSSTMKATLFEFQKVIPPSAYHHQRKSMCTDCISRLMRKNVPSDSVRLFRKSTLPPILRVAACSSSLLLFNPPTPLYLATWAQILRRSSPNFRKSQSHRFPPQRRTSTFLPSASLDEDTTPLCTALSGKYLVHGYPVSGPGFVNDVPPLRFWRS